MINILPYNHKKMVDRLRTARVVTITLWAYILLVIIAGLLLLPLSVAIDSRFSFANNQIAQLEREGIAVKDVDIAALEARTKTLLEKLAAPLRPSPLVYIDIVRSHASGGISLNGYAIEAGEGLVLKVAGTAASRETLQRFVAALQKEERIASVESPVSNYVKSAESPFSLTIMFKAL